MVNEFKDYIAWCLSYNLKPSCATHLKLYMMVKGG